MKASRGRPSKQGSWLTSRDTLRAWWVAYVLATLLSLSCALAGVRLSACSLAGVRAGCADRMPAYMHDWWLLCLLACLLACSVIADPLVCLLDRSLACLLACWLPRSPSREAELIEAIVEGSVKCLRSISIRQIMTCDSECE